MKTCPKCGSSYDNAVGFCERDGEVLDEGVDEMVGQVLDGYEIESFIARGGMGTVYRARHILLGDRVVIKTLKPEMRNNAEWLRRFQREGRAARRFRHPNSVTVYDLRATADGLTYMVMEYVEGHTLDEELKRRGRFTPLEAIDLLGFIASVLEAAHTQGVVHRDLKPENVMLHRTADGGTLVKLLDLGIAKLRDAAETSVSEGGAGLTIAGQILGTPYYMSPEQWGDLPRDRNPEIDGRTDIYSLGLIFYELISGQKPFTGQSLAELRQAHVSRRLPPLHEIVPDVPEGFGLAVERAMAKDRDDRPATAGEFDSELRAALGLPAEFNATSTSPGIHATAPPRLESSQPFDRDNAFATVATRTGSDTVASGTRSQFPTAARQSMAQSSAHAPSEVVEAQTPPERSSMKLLVGGVLVMLLLVVGAGGWFVWKRTQARRAAVAAPGGVVVSNTNNAPAARLEVMSYWLEAFDDAEQVEGRRVAHGGRLSLASGQQFKFHFMPRERGYLYIIGPGAGNALTTFLTARPTVGLMKTNQATAGADFSFPYGVGQALQLDRNPATEEYTIIFSPTPLLTPAFLTMKAGHELTPAEVKELEELRARAKTATPASDVKELTGEKAAVAVSVPGASASGDPIIFEIQIEHR